MVWQAPKKVKDISQKDLRKCQDYCHLNLEDCRMAFRLDYRMFDCRAYEKEVQQRPQMPGLHY